MCKMWTLIKHDLTDAGIPWEPKGFTGTTDMWCTFLNNMHIGYE